MADCEVTRRSVLTAAEACEVAQSVMSLRHRWISRSRTSGFNTLGRATYIDLVASADRGDYFARAGQDNDMLADRFGPLYERLSEALAQYLKIDVIFHPALSRPGFHIFEERSIRRSNSASIHYDLQWQAFRIIDLSTVRTLSYTLPVAMPAGGAGLNLWPLRWLEQPKIDITAYVLQNPPQYVPYRLGEVVIHDGLQLHQIAGVRMVEKGDFRITLQGHALCFDSHAILYW